MQAEWVLDIRDPCRKARAPFFFNRRGGVFKKPSERQLKSQTYDEMPPASGIRAPAIL